MTHKYIVVKILGESHDFNLKYISSHNTQKDAEEQIRILKDDYEKSILNQEQYIEHWVHNKTVKELKQFSYYSNKKDLINRIKAVLIDKYEPTGIYSLYSERYYLQNKLKDFSDFQLIPLGECPNYSILETYE